MGILDDLESLNTPPMHGLDGGEMNAAKTHCKHGHPLSGDNLRIEWVGPKKGRAQRVCLECKRARDKTPEARLKKAERMRRRRAAHPPKGVIGYIFHNPDTGPEFSELHPVLSGQVPDAENIREATAHALLEELLLAWSVRIAFSGGDYPATRKATEA